VLDFQRKIVRNTRANQFSPLSGAF